jgi:hypothetical protein
VGEFGQTIEEAPYILESLIDAWEDEQDNLVKMELLTATMKLFFKRPPEVKAMLAKLLKQAINTQTNAPLIAAAVSPLAGGGAGAHGPPSKIVHIDVRDRALLYYRLLQFDVNEAARVVNSAKKAAAVGGVEDGTGGGRSLLFAEQVDVELGNKLFKEFNSLSVVYSTPQERFVKAPVYDEEEEKKREEEERAKTEAESSTAALTGGQTSTADAPGATDADDILPSNVLATAASPATAASASASAGSGSQIDLFGFDMSSLEVSSPQSSPQSAPAPSLSFLPGQTLDKATYQSKWSSLGVAGTMELAIRSRPITAQLVEQLLASSANIVTFASGGVGNNIKFFLFGRDAVSGKQQAGKHELGNRRACPWFLGADCPLSSFLFVLCCCFCFPIVVSSLRVCI